MTEPIDMKNPNVAADDNMYCDRVATTPRGPGPARRMAKMPKMAPIERPTIPVASQPRCHSDLTSRPAEVGLEHWCREDSLPIIAPIFTVLSATPSELLCTYSLLLSNVVPPATVCGGGGMLLPVASLLVHLQKYWWCLNSPPPKSHLAKSGGPIGYFT